MDLKSLIKVIKTIVNEEVRTVIKEELTEILKEGLQSTIVEIKTSDNNSTSNNINETFRKNVTSSVKQPTQFKKTKFSDILNETDPLFEDMSQERNNIHENFTLTSSDALNFGATRSMQSQKSTGNSFIHDPETGKNLKVDPVIEKAMTRDYSALLKAMDKKKGKL